MLKNLKTEPLFVLDIANNHFGDMDHARLIIESFSEIAHEENVKVAIKFQYRNLESFIHPLYKDRRDIKYVDRFLSTALSDEQFLELASMVKDNKIAADTRQQFIDISIKQAEGELKKTSNYYKNNEITNKILSGEINDLSTPFVLKGEDQPKSILQRAGDGVNPDVDLQFYVKYLLPNVKDQQFLNDNKRFFEFISKYERAVEGPKYASLLDINSDNRLNAFKNDMLEKFLLQRKAGVSTEELFNPKSKKFIGNNIANYMVNLNEVSKAIDNQYKPLEGKPLRVKGEKPEDYLKRIGK